MRAHNGVLIALAGSLVAGAGGCSGQSNPHPKLTLVPVHGVVRLDGRPVDKALVTFTNPATGAAASGITDAEGKFTLTTYQPGDGATPGKNLMTVTKAQEMGPPAAKTAPPVFRHGASPHERWLVPQRYSDINTSRLSADVVEGQDQEIVVDLRS